jgi:membrane-bound lytic murein transglycosylase MltF
VFIPLSREALGPALLEGRVDIIAAQLTITDERKQQVDFTNPTRTGVNQIVVTAPNEKPLSTKADLSGREVFVRPGSLAHESVTGLSDRLVAQKQAPIQITLAPEALEDEDLLEMANAGLVRIVIVDDYLARFWKQIYTGIVIYDKVALRLDGAIAPAIRKNSPQLMAALNGWIKKHGPRTAFGNMMATRYTVNPRLAKSATSDAEIKRFQSLVEFFKKYSDRYKVDYLLVAAQGYQESGLDQSVKSPVGAIGVMQVMPATGKELAVGDIAETEANIHAGVKYIRFMIDRYYKDEPMDDLNKGLFAFASYNAGPARVRQLRAEAAKRGLDPNRWFNHVEQIASERIGRETVTYVANIYKYYIAYRLAVERRDDRANAKQ